jgi:hypothetical protein
MSEALWLDSSVVLGLKKSQLRELTDLAREKGIRVVVHAHIHLEMCRNLREKMRIRDMEFSPSYIQSHLDQLRIEVAEAALDRAAAEGWALLLDQRYSTEGAWLKAKLDAVRARLPEGTHLRADRMPMTTDWLVALEIERQGAYVAVCDEGIEWKALREMNPCRALSYDEAMRWLQGRVDAGPDAPSTSRTGSLGGSAL